VRNKIFSSAMAAVLAVPLAASLSFGLSWFSHNSSTKSTKIDLVSPARVGAHNELKAGNYRVKYPLRTQQPEVKFYRHGNLVAVAPAHVKHLMAKNQNTEVYLNKLKQGQIVTQIRPDGTREALVFTTMGKKKAGA
jgi:hypothetical protein